LIVVDTSIWIDWFGPSPSAEAERLRADIAPPRIILCDVVLLEILRGARSDTQARRIELELRSFRLERTLDRTIAIASAQNVQSLRSLGKTMSKTADLIIGTFCIAKGYSLLTKDRDFLPMAEHLGLRLA
jgi:predicted nucleic acid-binding protein